MLQYFVFQDKDNLKLPDYRNEIPKGVMYRVAYFDSETIPGSNFFAETTWIWAVEYGSLTIRNVKKPIFHYTTGPWKMYK